MSYLVQGSRNCDAFNLVNLERAKMSKKTFTRLITAYRLFIYKQISNHQKYTVL